MLELLIKVSIAIRKHLSGLLRIGSANDFFPSQALDSSKRVSLAHITKFGLGGALLPLNYELASAKNIDNSQLPDKLIYISRLNIRSFGAFGDRRTDDFNAINRTIIRSVQNDQYPASIFVPSGNYRRSESIEIPSHSCFFGEGVSSIFNSQNDKAFDQPIMVNSDEYGLISARLQDLSFYGGSHALKLQASEENADVRLSNVTMLLQSNSNIEVNKLFQTVKIVNCVFGDSPYGIKVLGPGTNCLIATGSEWIRHSQSAIMLRGADGVTIVGGRFEAGGVTGRYCLDIERASNILFIGCFFEDVHEYLARFRDISGSVVFQSCHFTGTHLGGQQLRPFRWDTADNLLVFRDCISVVPMPVGGHLMLEGSNPGISAAGALYQGTQQAGRIILMPRQILSQRLAEILAISGPAAWCLQGRLSIMSQDGRHCSADITISDSSDVIEAAGAFKVRLLRKATDRWSLLVTPNELNAAGATWTFDWISAGVTAPFVRASLA